MHVISSTLNSMAVWAWPASPHKDVNELRKYVCVCMYSELMCVHISQLVIVIFSISLLVIFSCRSV